MNITTLRSDLPHLVTELPGPRANAVIERDRAVLSPSYTRPYPLVVARGEGAVIEDVDGAPVGDLRNREPGNPGQGLLVIERLRQDRGRVGEERRLHPGRLSHIPLRPQLVMKVSRSTVRL